LTDWLPATEAETAMRDSLRIADQELYFHILARTELLLPVSPEALAGRAPMGWGTWNSGGRTHVLAFTSPEAMRVCLAEHAGSARKIAYHELAAAWPNHEWWLAVNPGLPIEGYLPPWFVTQLARGDVRMPGRTTTTRTRVGRGHASPPTAGPARLAERNGQQRSGQEPNRPERNGQEPAPTRYSTRSRTAFTRGTAAAAATGARREAARATSTPPRSVFTPTPPAATDEPLEAEMVDAEPAHLPPTGAHSARRTVAASAQSPAASRRPRRHDAAIIDAEIIESTVIGATALDAMVVHATVIDASQIDSDVIDATLVDMSVHDTTNRRARTARPGLTGEVATAHAGGPPPRRRDNGSEPVDHSATRRIDLGAPGPADAATRRIDVAGGQPARARRVDMFGNAESDSSPTHRIDVAAARDMTDQAANGTASSQARDATDRSAGDPSGRAADVGPGRAAPAADSSRRRRANPDDQVPSDESATRRIDASDFRVDTSPTQVIPGRRGVHAEDSETRRIDIGRNATEPPPRARRVDLFGNEDTDDTQRIDRATARRAADQAARAADPSLGGAAEETEQIPASDADAPTNAADDRHLVDDETTVLVAGRAGGDASVTSGSTGGGSDGPVPVDQASAKRAAVNQGAHDTSTGDSAAARDEAADETGADDGAIEDAAPYDETAPAFEPANDTEEQLLEAAGGGQTEQFLSTLLLSKVLVPLPPGASAQARLDDADFPWRRDEVEGQPYLVVFTSPERMAEFLGDDVVAINAKFIQLIHVWPDVKWAFAVNPGSPVGAMLPGIQIKALAAWADDAGLTDDEGFGVYDEGNEPEPTQKAPVVMQKPIASSQVDYYLERGYDRASGFVHRATEVMHMHTPAELIAALGLTYTGSPFRRDASEVYLLRWMAFRPDLYRIPYGGQHEAAMRAMQGWMIERAPFRGNGFAPAEDGQVIAEFKVDSIRLPHGAQMWRLTTDGRKTLIAMFDADEGLWRPVRGVDSEAVWDPAVPVVPPTPSVEAARPAPASVRRARTGDPGDDPLDPRWRGSGRRGPRASGGTADPRARSGER
jgi:hypothetical protein